eukprot:gene6785-6479_t
MNNAFLNVHSGRVGDTPVAGQARRPPGSSHPCAAPAFAQRTPQGRQRSKRRLAATLAGKPSAALTTSTGGGEHPSMATQLVKFMMGELFRAQQAILNLELDPALSILMNALSNRDCPQDPPAAQPNSPTLADTRRPAPAQQANYIRLYMYSSGVFCLHIMGSQQGHAQQAAAVELLDISFQTESVQGPVSYTVWLATAGLAFCEVRQAPCVQWTDTVTGQAGKKGIGRQFTTMALALLDSSEYQTPLNLSQTLMLGSLVTWDHMDDPGRAKGMLTHAAQFADQMLFGQVPSAVINSMERYY